MSWDTVHENLYKVADVIRYLGNQEDADELERLARIFRMNGFYAIGDLENLLKAISVLELARKRSGIDKEKKDE